MLDMVFIFAKKEVRIMLKASEARDNANKIAIESLTKAISEASSKGSHSISLSFRKDLMSDVVTSHFIDLGYQVFKDKITW